MKGVRFSIYLYDDQLEYIDGQAEKEGLTRSKYIEMKLVPESMWRLKNKVGNYGKGQKKDEK